MSTRTLKIEDMGDWGRGKVVPAIRLKGKWLGLAGFKPGHRVEVVLEQAGKLSLRIVEEKAVVP
jgi:hypothetical protein